MVQKLSHPVQPVETDRIVAGTAFKIGKGFHIGAELLEIVESHARTLVQGWRLVND